jgi:hypothetical protein
MLRGNSNGRARRILDTVPIALAIYARNHRPQFVRVVQTFLDFDLRSVEHQDGETESNNK